MSQIPKKHGNMRISKEEEDEILREICGQNGLSYSKLTNSQGGEVGGAVRSMEMFFSGYPKMACLKWFPNLTSLCIMGQQIERLDGLGELQKLKELWVSECKLKSMDGLEQCLTLRKLYLYSNVIKKIQKISHMLELEVLWLNNNEITIIEGLSKLTKLKDLNLAENSIEKIGNSLSPLINLENLEISGNCIYSFKDLTNLIRLPSLQTLGLKSPTYMPNPVCLLCNYSTHVLYHLPHLQRLDTYDVSSKTLRDLAETTVVRKKMYYNMRVKTLRRNMSALLNRLADNKEQLMKGASDRYKALAFTIKEIDRELEEMQMIEAQPSNYESGTESDKDAQESRAAEDKFTAMGLRDKQRCLRERLQKWERKMAEIDHFHKEAQAKMKQSSEMSVSRLMSELETGGNVRFENGTLVDVWFSSCQDLVLSRFCAADYKEYGIIGIKLNRITRVHNRILRTRFDEKLASLLDDDDTYLPTQRNGSYKKLLEYLFWVWDPELPGGLHEHSRILEEGFMDPETYRQLGRDGAVPLSNSLSLAERHRINYLQKQSKGKEFFEPCPFRNGQLVVAKVYMGKTAQAYDDKIITRSNYPKVDSVFRPRKPDRNSSPRQPPNPHVDTGGALAVSSPPHSAQVCECSSRQCEWFILDHALIMPEYVIDFEYITRAKARSPFAGFGESLLDKDKKVYIAGPDPHVDDDILTMEPETKPRPRLIALTEEILLKFLKTDSLANVSVLNLHGNGLTKLKHLAGMPNLKKLVISFNDLTRLDDVAHLHIEHLDASYNRISSLDGLKGMNKMTYLDMSWNKLHNIRDELSTLRKHAPILASLDTRYNPWQKPGSLRLRVIGRLKSLTKLDGAVITEAEATAALRMAAGSRISQVSLLAHSRTDTQRPRTLSLSSYAQVLVQTSRHKPDRVGEQDNHWYCKVTTLNLDGQHISKLSNLERLENLKWASFCYNDITKIEGLDACTNLEELSLENNCISRLEGISKLSKLRRLNVANNYLTSLDGCGLDKLGHLHYLSAENNTLTSLAGLQKVTSLIELYVGNNRIDNIREVFYLKQLPNFVILDMFGNPIAQESDNYRLFVIYHLKSIKALDGLAVESTEGGMAKDTFGGRLTPDFVAEKLGHSNFNEVRELDFPNSSLRTVDLGPPEQFIGLRSVNLEHNNMTSFSGLIYLVNLRVLCLNHNHIECIVPKPKSSNTRGKLTAASGQPFFSPEELTPLLENLEVLHLGYNGIKDMANLQLSRLASLKALFLQGNEVTKVEGLEGLQELRELVLDRNKIKNVTEFSFMNQWNLQELHMEENRLRELSNFTSLENLQRLYLGMNRIQDIAELEKLEVLPSLIELSVVSNAVSRRLLHRPMLVYRMPNLMIIDGIPVSDEERTKAELYFMEQQPPQITTTIETTLPGIGQYKTQVPVKVTNMQLSSPPDRTWGGTIHYDQNSADDMPRGGGRRRGSNRGPDNRAASYQQGNTAYSSSRGRQDVSSYIAYQQSQAGAAQAYYSHEDLAKMNQRNQRR